LSNIEIHIVDGNNWANRAFYACPTLTNSKGEHVNAIRGFHEMVRALERRMQRGDHVAFAFDGKSVDTWRWKAINAWLSENRTYDGAGTEGYKGKRERKPELSPQIPIIIQALRLAGYPVFVGKTYEADDLIGTLAVRMSKFGSVFIHSSDKDFAQLVNKRVTLLRPKQDPCTPDRIKEVFGVAPSKIRDYLTMTGDAIDNVPGLPGVASATAIKLLTEYGNLDNIVQAVLDQKLKGNSKWVRAIKGEYPLMDLDLQRDLIQIDTNVPKMPKSLRDIARKSPDDKALKKLKRRLEMSELLHV
jgi:DNA polymerase-1